MAMRLISVMDGLQFVFSTTELWHQMPQGRPHQRMQSASFTRAAQLGESHRTDECRQQPRRRIASALRLVRLPYGWYACLIASRAEQGPGGETAAAMLRLTAATIVFNLLALPLYVPVPGRNLVLFLALSGYLPGRGYFEVVALRRFDAAAARAMRNRLAGRIYPGGARLARLFLWPLVKLVAPVIAAAFTTQIFEMSPRARPRPAARSTA
jgi:hypothetical protein